MPWVLEAVGNPGIGPDDDNPAAHAKPSWLSAYALCPYTDLAEPLLAVLGMDARMRDSVKITASKAVTPWIRLGLMARDAAMQLTAVEMVSVESFDITMLDEPDATLFVPGAQHRNCGRSRGGPHRLDHPPLSPQDRQSPADPPAAPRARRGLQCLPTAQPADLRW